jgi:protein-tyrosine phosphatase
LVDLHTHILPGVDDGAATLEDSLAMARMALADGITTIVATPHRNAWTYHAELADAQRRLAEVQQACDREGLTVRLLLGGEAYIAPDLADQVRDGLALTINGGRYLLVEWPFDEYPIYTERAIFDLQLRGIVPVMAHAERYRAVQRDLHRLDPLVERGVPIQVTASSLLGEFGPVVQRTAEALLVHDLAHIIASDSHAVDRRAPVLSAGRAAAAALVGQDRARALVEETPQAIVDDRTIELPAPKRSTRKPFWAFWRSGE